VYIGPGSAWETSVDKALSIVTAVAFVLAALLVGWLLSGGTACGPDIDYGFPRSQPRSLAGGVALLGGPLGTWGGVVMLTGIGLVTYGLQELCNYWFALVIVRSLAKSGRRADEIAARIDRSPVSGGLKKRLKRWLDKKAKFTVRDAK